MTDFSSLQTKVADLKTKVSKDSITPLYLGSLLDDFIAQMQALDMTGMSDDIASAISTATTALTTANTALSTANAASSSASSAVQNALSAIEKANTAISNAAAAVTTANSAKTVADAASSKADTASTTASSALSKATQNASDIQDANDAIDAINDSIGMANGIAPLDANRKIPSKHLPAYVDDVIEFDSIILALLSVETASANYNSTDAGCALVFDNTNKRFLLKVTATGTTIKYYNNWLDAERVGESSDKGRIPESGKIYACTSNNKTYRWSGSDLIAIGSDLALGHTSSTAFPGDEGVQLQNDLADLADVVDGKADQSDLDTAQALATKNSLRLDGVAVLPFNGIYNASSSGPNITRPIAGVHFVPSTGCFTFISSPFGYTSADYNVLDSDNAPVSAREDRIYRYANNLYRVVDGKLREFGSSDGNCLNVTVELPKSGTTNPYYDLESATAAIYSNNRTKLGLQITFAVSATSWKQYQYIGSSLDHDDFCSADNWIDMAGQSAGKEPVININALCGEPSASDYYSFESAIDALSRLETSTKVTYRKGGMVITYRTGEATWETLQLQRPVADFGTRAAWAEFGGGSSVQTSDTPAAAGTDAFSTGGAYNALPVDADVAQENGTVAITLKNAAGDAIMSPITFAASSGGGSASGTVVSIKFKSSPLFGALGSTIATTAAIRSITMSGTQEVENAIATLELVDRDTNVSVWSETVNKASSASMDDDSFSIDFTPFFTSAAQRRFTLIATDEGGFTAKKFITVTAEDLTCSIPPETVLNVREDAQILTTASRVSVDLFKFENNQSDKGIEALVEILINGTWTQLHKSVVTDTFTHSVSFSPSELGLTHGAYPIRMAGTSKNSGVKGNTIYSALFVVDPTATTPLVAIRYDDKSNGKVKLYESLSFDVAVYNPSSNDTIVNTLANTTLIAQLKCDNSHTYTVSHKVQNASEGDVLKLLAKVVTTGTTDYKSMEIPITVNGSVIDAVLKDGALYGFDFSSRSNDDADHSIADGDYAITVNGANWSSNGFAKYLGQNCLRIAENVTASLNHAPFSPSTLENSGMAIQMQFATNNIKDADAMLMKCYDATSGAGFYIKGNKVAIFCKNGNQALEERAIPCGRQVTLGITIEPASVYVERSGVKYAAMRMYLDGELVAHIGYTPGRGDLFNASNITMDGTNGDFYLYYMIAYQSHYEWAQAFKNYLVKLSDTEAMITEFTAEDVLVSQTAEGSTAMRPSASALWNRGMPYVVLVADDDSFNAFDNGTSTSDNFSWTVYYYDPTRPWRSFKATGCRIRRQGTTSAKRPKKNVRIYLSKASEIVALFPDYTTDDALTTYALFAIKKVRVGENTLPVDLITIKIDFSDAGGANDCGVCDQMNATYRALGANFMTPAQRFYDGTWAKGDVSLSGLEMNHSTANHPVAVFRSTSDTLQNVYFEAKGNWKEDKGEQTALGFMATPGYNKGCLNYQDGSFVEYYGTSAETLAQTVTRFLADTTVDTSKVYLISEYCGNRYKFYRYQDEEWTDTTGSMKQINGTWTVTGDVLNPVDGYELLNYQGFCWWRGVDSVAEMMKTGTGFISSWVQKLIDKGLVTADVVPQWTYYFECMVDNDDLAVAYASGKKVPFELYRRLRFFDNCDPDKNATTYAALWKNSLYKFVNVRSQMAYYTATDYNSLYDQQAKNMQPMFFLEDGCYVSGGVYYNASDTADGCDVETTPSAMLPVRMYFNKVYDADGANGKDNDGGCTGDPECDPAKATDEATGYANPYAGWNSILWVVLRAVQEVVTDDAGGKIDLRTVVAAMRSVEATVDGQVMKPFSPEGAKYFFLTKRLQRWPKMVSSYDGIRKYVQYTATADAIYFYALQGLGLTSLPAFIEQRWRIRDGYYQTGAFFSGYISFRIACAEDAKIRIKAAKTGYFGIGNDNTASVSEPVFLEAGEEHEFSNFSHQTGALIYIYQADRMSEIDLSEVSLGSSNGTVDFSVMGLVTTLTLGSATHSSLPTGYTDMVGANLGNLPFLESLDIRRTGIKSIDLSGCPRLSHFDARESSLTSFSVAETSPINDIAVPGSLTELRLIGLPNLTYTGLNAASGLRVPSLAKVQTLRVESSPNLSARRMLQDTLEGQSSENVLAAMRINNQAMKGDTTELHTVLDRSVVGLDRDGNRSTKPVIIVNYELTTILDQSDIDDMEARIEGLSISTVIEAFIELIDGVNGEYYSGDSEVETVTLDNIGTHLAYYNGETYAEYVARIAEANRSIHTIITE